MSDSESPFRQVLDLFLDSFRSGWHWISNRIQLFWLQRQLEKSRNKRARLFEQLGERAIELGMSIDDPNLKMQLERLDHERASIESDIEEKEQKIQSIKSNRTGQTEEIQTRLEELQSKKEELEEKLKLNKVSLERARDQKKSYSNRLRRKEQNESESPADGDTPELAPEAPLGPAGQTTDQEEETESDPDPKDREELEKSVNRTNKEIQEIQEKRDRLTEEKNEVEEQIRTVRKTKRNTEEGVWSEIRSIEDEISDLERKLDTVDREKKKYSRKFGENLYEEEASKQPLKKYSRRLDRIAQKVKRTKQQINDVRQRIAEIDSLSLLLFVVFWLFVFLLIVAGFFLVIGS